MNDPATSSVLSTIENLGLHEHLAFLYSGTREQTEVIIPFVRTGLERSNRCLYFVDDTTSTATVGRLRSGGLDVDAALQSKSLVIVTKRRGYFDPDAMINDLKEASAEAQADGFSALRITTEMAWLLGKEGGIERLNDFEAMLNYYFPQYPALGICQYDLHRFKPETIKEIVLAHPSVVVGGSIRKNPMEGSNVRLNLVITEHHRIEQRLRQSEARLAEAQRLAHLGSYEFDLHTGETKWSEETYRMLGMDPSWDKPSLEEFVRMVHPEDRMRVERTMVSALKEKSPFELEYRVVIGHSVKHMVGLGQVALDEAGEVTRLYGTVMDITERRRILDALQASEERYKRLLSSVTDYVYSVQIVEGQTASTSHGAGCLAVTGYSPEDHIADPFLWYKMVVPEDRILVTEEAERRMRGQSAKPLEHRIIHKNGSIRWVRNTIVPRRNADGTLTGYDGLVEDITERKNIEESVRDSETQYRAMIEAFDGLVYVCSQDFHVEYMNERLIRRTGRDATGELCYEVLHDLSQKCPWCVNDKVFTGDVVRWEVQSPKDGRWYDCVNSPILHADGRISKQAMIQDITERKAALEALKEIQSRYKDLVETIDDWIWEVDEKGIYTFASPRVREILGYEPEELIGKSCLALLMPEEIDRVSAAFREAVDRRQSIVSLENTCRHKDGHPVALETSGKPYFDAEGRLVGYRGVDRVIAGRDRK